MVACTLTLWNRERFGRVVWVRLGLYAGVVLAVQYLLIHGFVLVQAPRLWSWEAATVFVLDGVLDRRGGGRAGGVAVDLVGDSPLAAAHRLANLGLRVGHVGGYGVTHWPGGWWNRWSVTRALGISFDCIVLRDARLVFGGVRGAFGFRWRGDMGGGRCRYGWCSWW